MKAIRVQSKFGPARGFTLVESTLSLGILTCALVSLFPVLAVGLELTRGSHDNFATCEIVRTLTEEARQGTLGTATLYADTDGRLCSGRAGAAYSIQPATQVLPGAISRLTLQVAPVGAPQRASVYAVVFPTAP